jgi:hypothetical protein
MNPNALIVRRAHGFVSLALKYRKISSQSRRIIPPT